MVKNERKYLRYTAMLILLFIAILTVSVNVYLNQPIFGESSTGRRLSRAEASPHYKDGSFQNISYTPTLGEGYSIAGEMMKQLFESIPRKKPEGEIPLVKTDLFSLPKDKNVLIWFGHSSYYMQINGVRYLVDPVFSNNASPVPGTVKPFSGTNKYKPADIPEIDYLLITHDHYDHLDYETVKALKSRIKKVICGLGTGAHFERWGYPASRIFEKDWYEKEEINSKDAIYTESARHQSGRGLKRNNTLWLSYILKAGGKTIYIGGDSGYDVHFKSIGEKYGFVDLAILENGQYNKAWPYIHMSPGETLKAASDLNTKRILPVHSSKFALARHSWDEPLNELARLNKMHIPLVTPVIGEVVELNNEKQVFREWWKNVK